MTRNRQAAVVISFFVLLLASSVSAAHRRIGPAPQEGVLEGVILKLDGSSITIGGRTTNQSAKLGSATGVTVDGQPASIGALNAGDDAALQVHEDSSRQLVADAVSVEHDHDVTGVVTSVSATSLTIDSADSSHTFALTADTVFIIDGQKGTAAGLATGMKVEVASALRNGTLTALLVREKTEPAESEGTVTAISATSITVHSSDGTDTTSAIDSHTVVRRGGKVAAVADITVGAHVHVSSLNGTAVFIEIQDPNRPVEVHGTISAVGTDSITVHPKSGADVTVGVNSTTIIRQGSHQLTLADLKVGDVVEVEAQQGTGGALTAIRIQVETEDVRYVEVHGTITAVTGSVVTVQTSAGTSVDVSISSTTVIRLHDGHGSVSDLTVGASVEIEAKRNADNSLTALFIEVLGNSGGGDHGGPSVAAFRGTVGTVSASSFTLTTSSGSVTLTTDSSTMVRKNGHAATVADLASGQHVSVVALVNADHSYLAKLVVIEDQPATAPLVELEGTIKSVGTTSLVVTAHSGDVTVTVDSSTVITNNGHSAHLSDLSAGERVEARAQSQSDASLLAKTIAASQEHGH
jgi:hypothetical protein